VYVLVPSETVVFTATAPEETITVRYTKVLAWGANEAVDFDVPKAVVVTMGG
jgi:hypothetical protein